MSEGSELTVSVLEESQRSLKPQWQEVFKGFCATFRDCSGWENDTLSQNMQQESEIKVRSCPINELEVLNFIFPGKGLEVVKEIVEISLAGRAAKQNPTLYALAICARYPCETLAESDRAQVRIAAYEAFLKVCRIPTHVFTFVGYCEAILDKKTTGRRIKIHVCCLFYKMGLKGEG